ncbi:hypothetical protein [Thalassorhabdomicrobium marinisediminis]|nr:hypothetical protein [Thalassorhabdomicrobium marinisediminis]
MTRLAALLVLVGLAACGADGEPERPSGAVAATPAPVAATNGTIRQDARL